MFGGIGVTQGCVLVPPGAPAPGAGGTGRDPGAQPGACAAKGPGTPSSSPDRCPEQGAACLPTGQAPRPAATHDALRSATGGDAGRAAQNAAGPRHDGGDGSAAQRARRQEHGRVTRLRFAALNSPEARPLAEAVQLSAAKRPGDGDILNQAQIPCEPDRATGKRLRFRAAPPPGRTPREAGPGLEQRPSALAAEDTHSMAERRNSVSRGAPERREAPSNLRVASPETAACPWHGKQQQPARPRSGEIHRLGTGHPFRTARDHDTENPRDAEKRGLAPERQATHRQQWAQHPSDPDHRSGTGPRYGTTHRQDLSAGRTPLTRPVAPA